MIADAYKWDPRRFNVSDRNMTVCGSYLWRIWRRKIYFIACFVALTLLLFVIEFTIKRVDAPKAFAVRGGSEKWPRLDRQVPGVHFLPRQQSERKLMLKKPQTSDDDDANDPSDLSAPNAVGPGGKGKLKWLPAPFDRAEYDQPNSDELQHVVQSVSLYVPEQRLVHFDLKGAPPKVEYLIQVLRLSAKLGATGVLVEYEDMFPFHAQLSAAAASNHYSRSDVTTLLETCRQLKLEVIPLVQTFGHMEFILKLKEFSHLRDSEKMPESICTCHKQTMPLIKAYIDQVMSLHPDVKYLHIGCDEVYHLGECDPCQLTERSRAELFVDHVERVAKYVKAKYKVKVIIWDDMLRNFLRKEMQPLATVVEPMVWVYAEDVYRLMPSFNFDRLAEVFDTAWTASAFKGAHGPTLMVPPVQKHLTNTLNWLNVMSNEASKFKHGFRGIVTTGWQRYDHFSVLCELLPAAIPSLAVSLIAMEHGYLNSSLKNQLYDGLECSNNENVATSKQYRTFIDLVADPFLWSKMSWCFFPGVQAFKLTEQLVNLQNTVGSYLRKVKNKHGWLTDFNLRRNYSSPFRIDEGLDDFSDNLLFVTDLMKDAKAALDPFFDGYTVAEWIEQRVYPMYLELQELKSKAESVKKRRYWTRRPFEPSSRLSALGLDFGLPTSKMRQAPASSQRNVTAANAMPKRLVQQPDLYRKPSLSRSALEQGERNAFL